MFRDFDNTDLLGAAVVGGLSAAFSAPILWVGLLVFEGTALSAGFISILSTLAFLSVVGLVLGLIAGLIYGFPAMKILKYFQVINVFSICAVGVLGGFLIGLIFNLPFSGWPTYLFLMAVSGISAWVSMQHLFSNKALKNRTAASQLSD